MTDMKLEQLRVFLAVLEHGSFSRAAESMGVGQSTVSFHIAALESVTNTRLLDRGRGVVRPTPQGVLLQRYAQRIVLLSTEALRHLVEAEAAPSGHLRIATSTIVAAHLIPPILYAFRATCPKVSVSIDVSDSRDALEALRSQQSELALIGAPARDRRFSSARFAHDDVVLVGPQNGKRSLAQPSALAQLPLVLREPGSGTRSAVASFLAEAVIERADVIAVGSTEAARQFVLAGLGYTFISRRAIEDDLTAKRLRVVSLPGTPVRRWFHVVQRRSQTPSPAAKAFYELVLSGLQQDESM